MKIYRAYAKVNIFLKITGIRAGYHEITSRFVKVPSLYDELSFVSKEDSTMKQESFLIMGNFSCDVYQNTIYKAYFALKKATQSKALEQLMKTHGIKVNKNIPAFAGLGGGSSDAAAYLKMCNEVLQLGLSLDELATIGLEVGADVPFFIYDYTSANVSGIGEEVSFFEEDVIDFDIFTPNIQISTPKVYSRYRSDFYDPLSDEKRMNLEVMSSLNVLDSMDAFEANDLFAPALKEYPTLQKYVQDGWHFSGSGSSFFKAKA